MHLSGKQLEEFRLMEPFKKEMINSLFNEIEPLLDQHKKYYRFYISSGTDLSIHKKEGIIFSFRKGFKRNKISHALSVQALYDLQSKKKSYWCSEMKNLVSLRMEEISSRKEVLECINNFLSN